MFLVERIWCDAPQAQVTVIVWYSGWMSGFIAVVLRR
jgi:hypothetical protein